MNTLRILVLSSSLVVLAGCESFGSLNPMGGGGGGAAMVDSMKDTPTMYSMALPPGAAVGCSWETEMSGMVTKCAVVAEKDGKLIVEQLGSSGVVEAFLVDPNVDLSVIPSPGEKMPSNVSMAWVGAEGDQPVERKIMDVPVVPEPVEATGEPAEFTEGTETVNMGGRDWNTKWMESGGSKSWTADGFRVRSDFEGKTVIELTKWSDSGAEPMLDWKE